MPSYILTGAPGSGKTAYDRRARRARPADLGRSDEHILEQEVPAPPLRGSQAAAAPAVRALAATPLTKPQVTPGRGGAAWTGEARSRSG